MVARELTKHCFHRILRCLCSFAVDAQLPNRCLASTYKYQDTRVSLHHTSTPGSASLRCGGLFIYGAFLAAVFAYTRLRVSLHHTSTSGTSGKTASAMTSSRDAPILWLPCTIASSTPTPVVRCVFRLAPMSHGGDCLSACSLLFICLIFMLSVAQHVSIHCLFRMGGSDSSCAMPCYAGINLHTAFRYEYVCYVRPLEVIINHSPFCGCVYYFLFV